MATNRKRMCPFQIDLISTSPHAKRGRLPALCVSSRLFPLEVGGIMRGLGRQVKSNVSSLWSWSLDLWLSQQGQECQIIFHISFDIFQLTTISHLREALLEKM